MAHGTHFLEVRRTVVHAIGVIRIFPLLQRLIQIAGHIIRYVLVSRIVGIIRLHVQINKRYLIVLRHRLHHAASIVVLVAGREYVTATVQVHRRNQDCIGALCLRGIHILLDIPWELRRFHITSGLAVVAVVMTELYEEVIALLEFCRNFVQATFFNECSRAAATDSVIIYLHAGRIEEITKDLSPTRLRVGVILISANRRIPHHIDSEARGITHGNAGKNGCSNEEFQYSFHTYFTFAHVVANFTLPC